MNEMERYLYNHAYISNVKTCNRQSELSKERAECIANKYNSLVEEKDKEIERLNNIIDELHILFIEFDRNVMRRKYVDANMINLEIKAKLRELKEGK